MCFTIDQLDSACGILLFSDANVFTYFCKLCPKEFATGTELETHILFEHYDDEKKALESVFVSDDTYDLNQVDDIGQPDYQTASDIITNDETRSQQDVKDFSMVANEPNDYVNTESTRRKSKRTHAEYSRKTSKSPTSKVQPGLTINNAAVFVDTADISIKIETNQNRSLNTNGNRSEIVSKKRQNEAMSIDEFGQDSSDDNSHHNDKTEVHINESKNLKKPASTKKSPRRKRKKHSDSCKGIFYCDMCPGVTFSTLAIVKQHMKRHMANKLLRPCPLCPIRPRNMEKHMRIAHIEAKPYKCDFCDATFKHNIGRVNHMRTHTGERPYLCAICGKSFHTDNGRGKHNLRMHAKQLPHECTECGRRFIVPSQLQEHIYSFHSEERPYSCEICGNSYSTSKYLRKHRQTHGEKIHQCRHCEKKFKTTDTRRWHERTVHNIL